MMQDIDERYKKDVAKQRWKYNPEFCCINLDVEGLSPAICGKSYGTDEQMVAMNYAPDMLEALEALEKLGYGGVGVKDKVRQAIQKARGKQNG